MKGFLLFCVLLSGILLIGLALPHLDNRERVYEERLVGALNFAETTIEATLGSAADIYDPAIAPGSKPGHWALSGIVVSKNELNGKVRARFVADLESLCADATDSACWQTLELAFDGRVVRPESVADSIGERVIDRVADERGGPGATGDEHAVPAAAVQVADEAAVASSPASETVPAPAEDPIEATASVKKAPTPGELAEETVSGQELILYIQDALKKLGYKPGPADGKLGARTAAAIRDYQRDFDLPQDGRPSPVLLRHMRGRLSDLGQQSRGPAGNGALVAG